MPPSRTHETRYQALEVDTNSPVLPALAIIAPTPRAFTFPISHDLNSSTYSTPSNSPFEPELCSPPSPASSYLLITPPLSRTPSPTSSASFVSVPTVPSLSSGCKSASFDDSRRPKKGDDDYIKRPENAFMLFRRKCCEDHQQAAEEASRSGCVKKQRQADLSKSISQQWKALSAEDRRYWEGLAKETKRAHQQMYPDYVFRPQRVRDQDGKARNKKYSKRKASSRKDDTDGRIAYIVPPPSITRSTSAPTPPPSSYQTIHVPNMLPSLSSSSSLLPMISHRAGYTGNADDIMTNFDFCPSNLPILSNGNSGHEAGLQVMCHRFMSSNRKGLHGVDVQSTDLYQTISTFNGQYLESNGNGSATHLQTPTLNMDSLSTSSSAASSPISEPFTPNSAVSSYYPSSGFGQPNAPLPSNTWNFDQQIPANLDVQTSASVEHKMDYSLYPWDPSTIWQTESSMLLRNDFDLDVVPPIEFKTSQYSEIAPFLGFPGQHLAEADYNTDLGENSVMEYGSEFWNST